MKKKITLEELFTHELKKHALSQLFNQQLNATCMNQNSFPDESDMESVDARERYLDQLEAKTFMVEQQKKNTNLLQSILEEKEKADYECKFHKVKKDIKSNGKSISKLSMELKTVRAELENERKKRKKLQEEVSSLKQSIYYIVGLLDSKSNRTKQNKKSKKRIGKSSIVDAEYKVVG